MMEPQTETGSQSAMPRELRILIGLGMLVLVIAGARIGASVIMPVFFALVLAITVHPIYDACARRGWPRWIGVSAMLAAAYGIVIALALAVVVAIAKFAMLVPNYKGDMNDLVDSATAKLQDLGVGPSQLAGITGSFDAGKLVSAAGSVLQSLLGLTSNLMFVFLLLLFIAMGGSDFSSRLASVRGQRPGLVTALGSFARGTRQYMVVSAVFGFIVAVLDSIFLAFTPVPDPLLWGLLAFVTGFIPNIGFLIGMVPPALLGLLEGGPGLLVLIIVVYTVLNFIIQSVIQPKFVGDAVGLSAAATFLSLVFWAWVFGATGALLAIPLTLLVKAFIVDLHGDSSWVKPLVTADPVPSVDVEPAPSLAAEPDMPHPAIT